MKKITLLISLCFLGLTGYAQQHSKDATGIDNQKRETEYIIVLDDTEVDGNIDILLNGNELHDENFVVEEFHELVHNAPNEFSLDGKLVEGAFSFNEYAVHYKPEIHVTEAAS